MSSHPQLDLLASLVQAAMTNGADAAEAVTISSKAQSISARFGAIEDVEGAESNDVGLRVIIGRKQAMASSSDLSAKSLGDLVDRTLAMARNVPDDAYLGQAPEDRLARIERTDLDLADPADIAPDTLADMAIRTEAATRAVEGVTNCDGASASASRQSVALVTSHGFAGHYEGTSHSLSVAAVAGEGTTKERDYDFCSTRMVADLDAPEIVGTRAGQRAVTRLGSKKIKGGSMPVVLAPRVSKSIVGHFLGAINGNAVARGSSFLKDALETEIFNPEISIIDHPFVRRGLRSRPYDGEGVAPEPLALVDDGILTTWTLNTAAALQLGLETTGHASRSISGPPGIGTSNTYLCPSEVTPEDLISDIKNGVFVTELIGMGVNGVTGDYSRGAAGFRIENGEITTPVSEITIAGNLKSMFRQMQPANDLEFRYGIDAPSIRINGMTVAGA